MPKLENLKKACRCLTLTNVP